MNRFLILVSLLFVAFSCNKNSIKPTDKDIETSFTISAALPEGKTKLASNTDSDESWTFSWEQYDAMGNWYTGCTKLEEFVNNKATGETASFSGNLGEGNNHRFIYPYDSDNTKIKDNDLYSIDISSQNGDLNKTYFITQEMYTTAQLRDGSIKTLPMEHIGGFMVVDVYLENCRSDKIYKLKSVKYYSKDNIVPNSAELDMTKNFNDVTLYKNTTAGAITGEMSELFETVVDEPQYRQAITRLNILPFEVKNGESVTIELTIEAYEKDKPTTLYNTYSSNVTLDNNGSEPLPFARATHNFTKLTVDCSDKIEITGATINNWSSEVDKGDIEIKQQFSYVQFKRPEYYEKPPDMTKVDDLGAISSLLSKFRRCLMTMDDNGNATICYLDNNNSALYNDGSVAALDGKEGDVMVYFPEYWYKYEDVDEDYFRYHFSESAKEGYIHVESSLVGAYKACLSFNNNYGLCSHSGVKPLDQNLSWTQSDCKQYAKNRGTGYQIIDYEQHCTIAMMLYAKYLKLNMQEVLGKGNADKYDNTGSTNKIGNMDTDSDSNIFWVNGLGLEGVFGGIGEWIDGVTPVSENSLTWIIYNPTENNTRKVTSSGYGDRRYLITSMALESGEYFDMVPTNTLMSGYKTDECYADIFHPHMSSNSVAYRSFSKRSEDGGVAFISMEFGSDKDIDDIGTRLAFRGVINEAESVSDYKALFTNE